MSDPTRVYMTLLIETDQDPADAQLAVMASINDRYKILNASYNVVGEDDTRDPDVTFVICPTRGLLRAFVDDPDAAEALAKREGAVTISWSADADHRGEVTV